MRRSGRLWEIAIAAVVLLSGCSQPAIEAGIAQDLQLEVQEIAVLTARGDTADAVAAAQDLGTRVRSAQAEGRISGDRAVLILQRVEQLIDRLTNSGAAPAPDDAVQPFAVPARTPVQSEPPKPEPSPTTTAPAELPAPAEVAPPAPAPAPEPLTVPEPPANAPGPDSGGDFGVPGPAPVVPIEAVPVPVIVDDIDDLAEDDFADDDGGKGRGRGRSEDD